MAKQTKIPDRISQKVSALTGRFPLVRLECGWDKAKGKYFIRYVPKGTVPGHVRNHIDAAFSRIISEEKGAYGGERFYQTSQGLVVWFGLRSEELESAA